MKAAVGNFAEAIANQRLALESKDDAATEREAGKKRLEMHEKKRPVRD